MFKKLCLALVISAGLLAPAYADDNGWSGEASLSGSKTTGNTETTDIGLGLKLEKQMEKWRHKVDATADYGKTSGTKDKSRWTLGYQIDRDVSERLYVYGNADYFQDDFGAFKQGSFIGAGLGYKAVLPEPMSWNLEAGAGYRSQKSRLAPGTPGGAASITENELALRGFSDFDYKFNDAVSLYNDTEIIWSDSDTYIWNETGLTAQLMGNLSARASFRIDTHSDVPAGRKKTDTITRIGVVYTIG